MAPAIADAACRLVVQFLRRTVSHVRSDICELRALTLNIRDGLLENLIKHLRVLELLLDLGDDSIRDLLLLTSLYLAFITHP